MSKFHKLISAAILCACMVLVNFQGCSNNSEASNTNLKNIQDFVENIFTVPYPELSDIAKSDLHLSNMDEYDKQIRKAISSLCGDNADIEKLANPSSRFYEQIIYLHLMADEQSYTIAVEHVEVTESENNDKQYGYKAVVYDSRENEPVTMSGSIQLNDTYKIDYMSVN